MVCFPAGSGDVFEQYLTDLLHITTTKVNLPPIQRGQHHVFSAEHTTRDILSFMAQVQGHNIPSKPSESTLNSLIEFMCVIDSPYVLQSLPCIYL